MPILRSGLIAFRHTEVRRNHVPPECPEEEKRNNRHELDITCLLALIAPGQIPGSSRSTGMGLKKICDDVAEIRTADFFRVVSHSAARLRETNETGQIHWVATMILSHAAPLMVAVNANFVFGMVSEADIERVKISARRTHDEDSFPGRVSRATLMFGPISAFTRVIASRVQFDEKHTHSLRLGSEIHARR
jgi:hypothetical protein